MIDPKDRLGAPGTKNDIKELQKHPFFTGIDFNNLGNQNIKEMIDEEDKERLEVIRLKKK